jgi:hypothetical protein
LGVNDNSSNITSIEELQTGDVVNYMSQGIYLRFLQFITIENQTNTSSLENNSSGLENNKPTQNIILKGPYNKIINISYDDFKAGYAGLKMKGDPTNLVKSNKLVNRQYKEDKRAIEHDQNTLNGNKTDYELMHNICTGFMVLAIAVFLYGTVSAGITYYKQYQHRQRANQFQAQASLGRANVATDPDIRADNMMDFQSFTLQAQRCTARAAQLNSPFINYCIVAALSFVVGAIAVVGFVHTDSAIERVDNLNAAYNKNLLI